MRHKIATSQNNFSLNIYPIQFFIYSQKLNMTSPLPRIQMVVKRQLLPHHVIQSSSLHASKSLIIRVHDTCCVGTVRSVQASVVIVTPIHAHPINNHPDISAVVIKVPIEVIWNTTRMA